MSSDRVPSSPPSIGEAISHPCVSAAQQYCASDHKAKDGRLYLSEIFALLARSGPDVAAAASEFWQEGELDGRFRELKEDIARRVRPVMPAIPEEEFEQLIEQMARIQYKYESMANDDAIRSLRPDP